MSLRDDIVNYILPYIIVINFKIFYNKEMAPAGDICDPLGTCSSYTPDIRSMWGYIVRTYVRSFVRSFVRSSLRHGVKVFALKFIRPHILKTL